MKNVKLVGKKQNLKLLNNQRKRILCEELGDKCVCDLTALSNRFTILNIEEANINEM